MTIPVIIALVVTAIWVIAAILMQKHLTAKEIYSTVAVISLINLNVDIALGQSLSLYYFGASPIVEWYSFIVEGCLGAAIGLIFLNFMPSSKSKFIWYLVLWSLVSLGFEWFMVSIGYLVYTGWRLTYSIPWYPAIFLFLRWHLSFIRG